MYSLHGIARSLKFSSIGILSLVLIACGGGGGGSSSPINPPISDTTPPIITMVGAEAINHEQGTTYDDQGATASDSVDGSVSVSSSGEVSNTGGVYTITYSASDTAGNTATAVRTITVADTQPPVISLIGDSEVSHEQGSNYIDAGASASDVVDGDVEVLISGDVDDEVGEYTVTFAATDAADNSATQTRLVTVVSPDTVGNDDGWVIPSFSGYQSPNSYNGYDLVWSDEFDASTLNTSDWTFEIGTGTNGWGNNELQYYTDRNLYLKDGMLVIRAEEESFGGRSYTSSRIKTQRKKNFQYGRIDIRARMPEGQGVWPALWMLGENINQVDWPYCGELDVMEMVGGGNGKDNRTVGTAHWNVGGLDASYSPKSFGNEKILPENLSASFHVYSIVWTSYRITWYVDDVQYHVMAIDNSASLSAFQKQFFMIFNVAVGGKWPGSPDSFTVFPQRMVVDYIRVFQDENGSTGGQSGSTYPVPGLIEAEDYNNMLGVQIETTTDTGVGFNIGYIDGGDWVEYSLDVANAGNYLIEYRLASQNGSDGFQTLIDGTLIDTQSVPNTGSWQSWITNSATVNLSAGEQILRLNAVGSEWNLNWIKFTAQ
jgi:beta-glucanase (GH16 family)